MSVRSAIVCLSLVGTAICCQKLSGQETDIPKTATLELLNEFQKIIPYHLAYNQQVLSLNINGQFRIDTAISWKENFKAIENQLDVQYRIVGDNLILFPRKRFLIQGFIYDEQTGESLPGAHLLVLDNQMGSISNEDGYYQMWLPEGPGQFSVSYLGYQEKSSELMIQSAQQVDIRLKPSLDLPEIIVRERENLRQYPDEIEAGKLPLKQMEDFPSIGAAMDLARYLQFMPGVTTGGDGFGGIHVRGGNADQNLVLLDGIPIYNPFHLFGVSSIFNGDAIQKVDLVKSYFSPEYSGRLSSVLNVIVRDGHRNKTSVKASAGLLGTHAVLETPIFENKGTLMLAGQRSHAGSLLKDYSRRSRFNDGNNGHFKPQFWDFYGKLMLFPGPADKLIINLYAGSDTYLDINRYLYENPADTGFYDQYRDEYYWGNQAGGIKWIRNIQGRAFLKINLYHSTYSYRSINAYSELILFNEQEINGLNELIEFRSTIKETGATADLSFLWGLNHRLKTGVGIARHGYTPGIIAYGDQSAQEPLFAIDNSLPQLPDTLFDALSFQSFQIKFYLEDQWDVSDQFKIQGGFNTILFEHAGDNFISWQPRMNINYRINAHQWNLSVNKIFQPQHLISANDNGLPNELWVPATQRIRPQESWSADLRWTHQLSVKSRLSSNVYYKRMWGLVSFKDDPGYLSFGQLDNVDASVWEEDIVTGDGENWGIENSFEYMEDNINLRLNYTFAKSSRFFSNRNLGYIVPYEFEVPHTFNMMGMWNIDQRWKLGLTWQVASGTRYNLIPGSYELFDRSDYFLEEFTVEENGVDLLIMPIYHRLDLVAVFEWGGPQIQQRLKLSLLNMYDRRNIVFPRVYRGEPTEIRLSQGLPFVPSLSYHFSFN